jgi:hypothetical protein
MEIGLRKMGFGGGSKELNEKALYHTPPLGDKTYSKKINCEDIGRHLAAASATDVFWGLGEIQSLTRALPNQGYPGG